MSGCRGRRLGRNDDIVHPWQGLVVASQAGADAHEQRKRAAGGEHRARKQSDCALASGTKPIVFF